MGSNLDELISMLDDDELLELGGETVDGGDAFALECRQTSSSPKNSNVNYKKSGKRKSNRMLLPVNKSLETSTQLNRFHTGGCYTHSDEENSEVDACEVVSDPRASSIEYEERMEGNKRKKISSEEQFDVSHTGIASTSAIISKKQSVPIVTKVGSKEECDIFFGIRVLKPKISPEVFSNLCEDKKRIHLYELNRIKDLPKNWMTLGVISYSSPIKKSLNDRSYVVWKLVDLSDCQNQPVKVLLFGECTKKFWKVIEGCVIALFSPVFSKDSQDKEVALKVWKPSQVVDVGNGADFGRCKALTKNGQICTNIVNLSKSTHCVFHIQSLARGYSASRGANKRPVLDDRAQNKNNSMMNRGLFINNRSSSFNCTALKSISLGGGTKDLNGIIKNRFSCFGAQNLMKSRSTSELHSKEGNHCSSSSIKSMKDFLSENIVAKTISHNDSPVPQLGKGLHLNKNILLCSPQKCTVDIDSAKRKAIDIVKQNGGIVKADPNNFFSISQKRLTERRTTADKKVKDIKKCESMNKEDAKRKVFTDDEIKSMLDKRSNHDVELERDEDESKEVAYFNEMEKKEKVESFLTETLEVKNCKVISCDQCRYTSHKQSDYCIANGHKVKRHKATKSFFRCCTCNKRVICYSILPTKNCAVCGENTFERVAMRDERKILLPNEKLLLRGEEQKFHN